MSHSISGKIFYFYKPEILTIVIPTYAAFLSSCSS